MGQQSHPIFYTGLILTTGITEVNVFVATLVWLGIFFCVLCFFGTTGHTNVTVIVTTLVTSNMCIFLAWRRSYFIVYVATLFTSISLPDALLRVR